ncbi:MAG: hypothetical protein IH947_15415 [Bacteroidetes bacterium]|nr:hypothetical protein [Bacteroidota bacterium]
MYGLSQRTPDMTTWAFCFPGLAMVILTGIRAAIRIGHKIGNTEAHILHAIIDNALEVKQRET